MDFLKLENTKLQNETVFLRGDLDVSIENEVVKEDTRLLSVVETLKYLRANGAYRVYLAGHRGRPEGRPNPELSLQPLAGYLKEKLGEEVFFVPYEMFDSFAWGKYDDTRIRIYLIENLRFWPGEELNDSEFAKKLANLFTLTYINEAFASSHRSHASIVNLPLQIKEKEGGRALAGIQFAKEVETLSGILEDAKRPLVSILSGVKKDKLDYVPAFEKFSDKVLVGGRLPEYLDGTSVVNDTKLIVARLMPDKEDITIHSIESFEGEIADAKTILLAGPIGKYEEEGHRQGTKRVFEAVANSSAYKIAGGGDTEDAIRLLGLEDKFDWISVGGGAMLEFLAKGTLPGIEALEG